MSIRIHIFQGTEGPQGEKGVPGIMGRTGKPVKSLLRHLYLMCAFKIGLHKYKVNVCYGRCSTGTER